MNTTKIIFFSIFVAFLIFFAIYSWIIFYHIKRFGYREGAGKKVMVIFLLVAFFIAVITLILALSVKWEFNIPIF